MLPHRGRQALVSNKSCLADFDNDETTNVETSRKNANLYNKQKTLERDSTLLSIVTRGIEPTGDSLSQNSNDSHVSGLNPILAEFIKSEKANSSEGDLDFRRESVTDFGQLNFRDDSDAENEGEKFVISEVKTTKSGLTTHKNKKFSIYSSLCNIV